MGGNNKASATFPPHITSIFTFLSDSFSAVQTLKKNAELYLVLSLSIIQLQ